MLDVNNLLPDWYFQFLENYDVLKNDNSTFYFLMNLKKIHRSLACCTLLRKDDEFAEEFLSIQKRTISVREYLTRYKPDFPRINETVVIGRAGFARDVDEWSSPVIIFVKNKKNGELYFADTDSGLPFKLIAKDFESFFVKLSDSLNKAKEILSTGRVIHRKLPDGSLVPIGVNALELNVKIKALKSLKSILKDEMYIHFDSEGFVEVNDYINILDSLLKMTSLDFTIQKSESNPNAVKINILKTESELSFDLSSDYIDSDLIDKLNSLLSAFSLTKTFIKIYPLTIQELDQSMGIAFCNSREIKELKKNDFIMPL